MKIAVVRESRPGEHRVALVPESCEKLRRARFDVAIEAGAGAAAGYADDAYRAADVEIESDPGALVQSADVLLTVNPPANRDGRAEIDSINPSTIVVGSLMPLRNPQEMAALAKRGATAFSTDAIPRTTRAQAMDTLSSMSSISGYKGVLLAAVALPKYLPMLSSAAGTVFPAKVFVIGAAVAGLQALATAKRLGATVSATDVRPEVQEQIESVGARYVGVELEEDASAGGGYAGELSDEDQRRQREMLIDELAKSDVVITTALIGGVFAPKIITAEMVRSMRPGSIIVDLAADGGGNCELSVPGQDVDVAGVRIMAPLNLPATVPEHASLLFSRNLTNFVEAFSNQGEFEIDTDNEIQAGCLITKDGDVVHDRTREALHALAAEATP
ncbi:MAG: NAD(P) transhydrogenase subunit alpha [Gammaproteobacteria bacterium]|nr:NAD(P) transhydrogenase subunit alpha [Gammaproteobacteria bacterium]MDE0440597.1 NAD(P) transhydrogenase subunit alpha [Gammaproteobacteria bacterium]